MAKSAASAPSTPATSVATAPPVLFSRLHELVAGGQSPVRVGGVLGSATALTIMAAMQAAHAEGRPVVAIASGIDAAEGIVADLGYFLPHPPPGVEPHEFAVEHFPGLTALPSQHEPVPPSTAQARLAFLTGALHHTAKQPFAGVTSVSALMQRLVQATDLRESHLRIEVGEELDPGDLVRQLLDLGFRQQPMVEYPGELSSRGGIIDIFPHAAPNPWRVEFFGDEVSSLRAFDATSQISFSTVDAIDLVLAGDPAALHDPEGGATPKSCTLLDYLPANTLLVTCEPHEVSDRADLARKSWPQNPAFRNGKHLWERLQKFDHVELFELAQPLGETINLNTVSIERYIGEPDHSADAIRSLAREIPEIRILARNEAEARRMRELLVSRNVSIRPLTDGGEGDADSPVAVVVGDLEEGFVCPEANIACLQHTELLQKARRRRTFVDSVQRTEAINDFLELHVGDLVVHVTHGIAQFNGMKTVTRDGNEGDFLELEFDGGTTLYVPAVNVSLVQKYIGAKGARPELSKLGGKRWVKKKAEVEASVLDMANEFLRLQAERSAMTGISVPSDDAMVMDFIAAFPYEETPDQETVDAEIAADQLKLEPMDRLICGDVGYGKTELAMRAAMRSVAAGYQVAILVPTTVLAEQHYQSFSERFSTFPITIDRLSRFRTAKESREILERAQTGGLDILIGTHRLLSKDVEFRNLGLVVIDEEQRFGVLHKERLKHLRRLVDVLTLTATPIPRTLHMSLLGIRDISSLATPPHNRLAVHTEVTFEADELIRHSILRELDRDGQVFFIHNRVFDIHLKASRIQQLVPEARIDFGHGQMDERTLQDVMERFVRREIDVLVATTIVESGLDIPSANTLFVSRADRFGLAELHQLRGRVGRYKHKAYAYFLVDENSNPSDIARRRLRAIAEFSHLGSGFGIAMRDLEIRGAGNIIGTEQSGQIAAVGYDLYCKLLQKAVANLKKETPPIPLEGLSLSLTLGFDLRIPESYVPDRRQRLDAYRKVFSAETVDRLREAVRDVRDRYGPPPQDVVRLIDCARLRLAAAPLRISAMRFNPGEGVFITTEDAEQVPETLSGYATRIAVLDKKTAFIRVEPHQQKPDQLIAMLLRVFNAGKPDEGLWELAS